VGLHEDSHDLSNINLEFVLTLNLVLEDSFVVFLSIFLVFILINFFHHFSVIFDTLKGFTNHSKGGIRKFVDFVLVEESVSTLINDVFHSSELIHHDFSGGLLLGSRVNSGSELLRDSEKLFSGGSSFFHGFDESREGFGNGCTDIIVSVVVEHRYEDFGSLFDVRSKSRATFVNENSEHLNGSVLLLNLISDNVSNFALTVFTIGALKFRENVSQLSELVLALHSHLGVEGGHLEDGRKYVLKVRCKIGLHQEADSLPGAEEVNALGILVVNLSLVILDVQEDLDHIVSNSLERLVSNCSTDDSDGFDDLSAELFVFSLVELSQELRKHCQSLVEVGHKGLFGLLSAGGQASSSVLLKHRHTVLDEQEEFLADNLTVGECNLFSGVLEEVSESGTDVSLDTGNGIIESLDKSRYNSGVVGFLEVVRHVIGKLSNSVSGGVPNLRVRVLEVLHKDRDHSGNLASLINVLSNLRESHNSSVFVSPVRIVGNSGLDKLSNKRKHDFISDAGNESVNTILSELYVGVIIFFFKSVTFLRLQPGLFNVFLNINHNFENLL
jgi:hypothetical protein